VAGWRLRREGELGLSGFGSGGARRGRGYGDGKEIWKI
jgi:hypothetical protein